MNFNGGAFNMTIYEISIWLVVFESFFNLAIAIYLNFFLHDFLFQMEFMSVWVDVVALCIHHYFLRVGFTIQFILSSTHVAIDIFNLMWSRMSFLLLAIRCYLVGTYQRINVRRTAAKKKSKTMVANHQNYWHNSADYMCYELWP